MARTLSLRDERGLLGFAFHPKLSRTFPPERQERRNAKIDESSAATMVAGMSTSSILAR